MRDKYNSVSLAVAGILCASAAVGCFIIASEEDAVGSIVFIIMGVAVLILSPFIIFFKKIQDKHLADRENIETRTGKKYNTKRERVQEKMRRVRNPQKNIRSTLRFGHATWLSLFGFIFAGFALIFFIIADEPEMRAYALAFVAFFLLWAIYDITMREYRILKKKIARADVAFEDADADFTEGAMYKTSGSAICIGRKYTFFICGRKTAFIPHENVLYAYAVHGHIDSYYNGAYAGRTETYFVCLSLGNSTLQMKCAEFAGELILEEYSAARVKVVDSEVKI